MGKRNYLRPVYLLKSGFSWKQANGFFMIDLPSCSELQINRLLLIDCISLRPLAILKHPQSPWVLFLSEAICTHRMQSLLRFMEVDLSVLAGNSEMLLFMRTVFSYLIKNMDFMICFNFVFYEITL